MQWRIYGEWALAEASDAVRSAFSSAGSQTQGLDNGGIPPDQDVNQHAATSPEERAHIRRAQVRKAQIKHRQRKANHVKQLELDASQLREAIAQTEAEVYFLRLENTALRSTISDAGASIPTSDLENHQEGRFAPQSTVSDQSLQSTQIQEDISGRSPGQDVQSDCSHAPGQLQQRLPQSQSHGTLHDETNFPHNFYDAGISNVSVNLKVDSNIATQRLHVSPSLALSNAESLGNLGTKNGTTGLTMEQEHMAINFILSLEHGCWRHFGRDDFHTGERQTTREKGHTLMASAYCMSTAPDKVYDEQWAALNPFRKTQEVEWQANGLTLGTLYGLAQSLNPSDLEVTPVQAWFELTSRYPLEKLLQQDTLDRMAQEFKGAVKCVIFGAAVERQAFESIVRRVLGPHLNEMAEQLALS